jgi:hypothetical protein
MRNFEKFRILPEKKWLNIGGNFGRRALCSVSDFTATILQLLDN